MSKIIIKDLWKVTTVMLLWCRLQKKALDIFRAMILTTPEKIFNFKYGVVLTKVIQDETVVGVSIEGAYLARSYLLGQMNSTYLMLLACQSNKKLDLLPIMSYRKLLFRYKKFDLLLL
jgi:hypothetical protein